jgi:hypothetical protein
VAARSKPWVCGRSLAGIVGSNLAGDINVCHLSVVCCQVEVSATSWSLVQRSSTECGVSECDHESLIIRSRPNGGLLRHGKKKKYSCYLHMLLFNVEDFLDFALCHWASRLNRFSTFRLRRFSDNLFSLRLYGASSFAGSIWFIPFFSTYGVSFSPLEIGYRATRVLDSGWMEYLVVRVYIGFSLISVRLISGFNITT